MALQKFSISKDDNYYEAFPDIVFFFHFYSPLYLKVVFIQ